jgi:hypothetical protein
LLCESENFPKSVVIHGGCCNSVPVDVDLDGCDRPT